jgi:transcriptional regulator with XRE-family HTH domain
MKARRKQVGAKLRELRLERNFSQAAVAEDLGVAHTTLSSWERGSRPMSIDSLFKLADYFQVDYREILNS